MKLDVECVRDVMLELETFSMGCHYFHEFTNSTQKHGHDNVLYTLSKLDEARYINAEIALDEEGYPHCMAVYNLTFSGHEFLNSIRAPSIWKQIQGAAREGGTECLKVVGNIGITLLEEAAKKKLGLD